MPSTGAKGVHDGVCRPWTPTLAVTAAANVYTADDHGPRPLIFALASEHAYASCLGSGDLTPAEAVYFRRPANSKGFDPAETILCIPSLAQDVTCDTRPRRNASGTCAIAHGLGERLAPELHPHGRTLERSSARRHVPDAHHYQWTRPQGVRNGNEAPCECPEAAVTLLRAVTKPATPCCPHQGSRGTGKRT